MVEEVSMQSEPHNQAFLNDGEETTTHDNHDNHDAPTPLPVFPLLSVFLIQMAEPITAAVIYPFINQFVRETGITRGDEKKTGYYAGMIESAFFLAECLTVVQWGYLSDKYGRRPILLCAPIGLAFSMLVFGSSTTFWPLVLSRCMQGIFNGNIGVTKTSIAELTDVSNRGDAYAYQPIVWSLGTTTAPILGGMLSNPATRWPDTLGRIAYLRSHPYFLPCFAAALFALTTFVFVYFGLKETLPSLVAKEKAMKRLQDVEDTQATEESHLIESFGQTYGTEIMATTSRLTASSPGLCSPKGAEIPEARPAMGILDVIFARPVLLTLLNHAFLTLLDMCYFTLLPLVYSTPIEYNGLGLDPFRIGSILATFGFFNSILQINVLGKLIRKYGARSVYRVAFSCLLGCFTMYPAMHYFTQRAGRVDGFVAGCIVLQLCFQTAIYMCYGSLQVVIVEAVPEGGPMGTVNGVAQMLGCAMRTLAPTFASSLFSISLERKLAGGDMVYYILMAITVAGIRCTALLPKNVEKGRAARRPSRSRSDDTIRTG